MRREQRGRAEGEEKDGEEREAGRAWTLQSLPLWRTMGLLSELKP